MNIRYVSNNNNICFSDLDKTSGAFVAEPKSADKSVKNNNTNLKKILKWGGAALLTAGAVGLIGPKNIKNASVKVYNEWFINPIANKLERLLPKSVGWNIDNERIWENGVEIIKLTRINKLVEILNRPHWSRAIMGIGVITQPWIDRHNKKVDEDTAQVSAYRTFGKTFVGLLTGISVRGLFYWFTNMITSNGRALDPEVCLNAATKKRVNVGNYKSLIATGLSLLAMYKTNQWLDAPLTNWFSKKLIKYRNDKKSEKEGIPNNVQPNQQPLNPQANTVNDKNIPFTYDLCSDIQDILHNNKKQMLRGGVVQ